MTERAEGAAVGTRSPDRPRPADGVLMAGHPTPGLPELGLSELGLSEPGLRRRTLLARLAAGTAVAWAAPQLVTMPVAAAASSCETCANLSAVAIPNPSAESVVPGTDPGCDPTLASCTPGLPEFWTVSNGLRVVSYGIGGYAPTAPSGAGSNFFSGPWDSGSASPATAETNAVPLDALCATAIDAGEVPYRFSAYLGGYATVADEMTVTAEFLQAGEIAFLPAQTATLGPVTAAQRNNATVLLPVEACGIVPPLSRFVRVTLTATKITPVTTEPRNTAYADLVALEICTDSCSSG